MANSIISIEKKINSYVISFVALIKPNIISFIEIKNMDAFGGRLAGKNQFGSNIDSILLVYLPKNENCKIRAGQLYKQ
jgi:hypothetical protein